MTQGGSLAASACSVQTDKIGKEALERNEYVYMYRNRIPVPSLAMVDDILTISEFGINSVKSNAYINSKIEMKKLTLNSEKCKKIHVACLHAHEKEMKGSSEDKYIGDFEPFYELTDSGEVINLNEYCTWVADTRYEHSFEVWQSKLNEK